MMAMETLEERVTALEAEVAQLKQTHPGSVQAQKSWWEKIREGHSHRALS